MTRQFVQKLFCSVFVGIFFLPVSTNAQVRSLSINDFALCLGDLGCKNIRITKEQLTDAKGVSPNFAWFTIDTLVIYVGEGNFTNEIVVLQNRGPLFTKQTKEWFQKWIKGKQNVTIIPIGHNKQGISLEWPSLSIIIFEALK